MKMKSLLIFIVTYFITLSTYAIDTKAENAIVIDYNTNEILFEKNAYIAVPPASMTKIMTVYVIFDRLENSNLTIENTCSISAKAYNMRGSRTFLEIGERVKIKDLLRGIIIQSGNDASVAIAECLSGTENDFAILMNSYAKQLGMKNSNFINSSGWPEKDHYSTVRDLAILSNSLIRDFNDLYEYFKLKEFTYNEISQPNRNKLLKNFNGADGLKTGYTKKSGWGISASATRDNRRITVVVNGTNSSRSRLNETSNLLNWAFNQTKFKSPTLADNNSINWELSNARANTILKSFLDIGISPRKLSAAGYAEYYPIVKGTNATLLANNNRIEIKLQLNSDTLRASLPLPPPNPEPEPEPPKKPKKTKTSTNVAGSTIDKEGPNILVNNTFIADENLTAHIKGALEDESLIQSLTIDGLVVDIINNTFNHSLFVTPKGQNIEIVAIDKFGNKTNTSVQLQRLQIEKKVVTFSPLDPRKIKTKINPNAVALIIGVEKYKNTFKAPFAENDALAFNDFVHSSFGVPIQNIKLLMNDEASRIETLKTIKKWLPKIIKENKTDFYLFFSGHGLASENGEDLYLLPSDGEPELLEYSSLMRNEIFDSINSLNPKSVTVFLDTCYSGTTRSEEFLVAAKPIFIEAQEQDIPYNFTVFSASAGRETAKVLPEAEHGLFSYFLMKGLEGEADANSDNQITNGELFAFINKNVSRQANQTPQLNGIADQVLTQW